jgi:hypothetical protein
MVRLCRVDVCLARWNLVDDFILIQGEYGREWRIMWLNFALEFRGRWSAEKVWCIIMASTGVILDV